MSAIDAGTLPQREAATICQSTVPCACRGPRFRRSWSPTHRAGRCRPPSPDGSRTAGPGSGSSATRRRRRSCRRACRRGSRRANRADCRRKRSSCPLRIADQASHEFAEHEAPVAGDVPVDHSAGICNAAALKLWRATGRKIDRLQSGLIAYLDSVKSRDPAARSRWDVLFYPGVHGARPAPRRALAVGRAAVLPRAADQSFRALPDRRSTFIRARRSASASSSTMASASSAKVPRSATMSPSTSM